MSQRRDPRSDRPDSIDPQDIDGHLAQRGQDLDAIVLAVAVGVFPPWHNPHPVPAVLDEPALPNGSEQGLGSMAQTRDAITGLILWPALADAMAVQVMIVALPGHCPTIDSGAGVTRRFLVMSRPRVHLSFAGEPGDSAAAGQPIANQAKPFGAAVCDGDQEVGTALGEIDETWQFAMASVDLMLWSIATPRL